MSTHAAATLSVLADAARVLGIASVLLVIVAGVVLVAERRGKRGAMFASPAISPHVSLSATA